MLADKVADSPVSNALEWSVTDLANALRRTLEDRFAHVRLRGEISGYRGPHASGHAYFSIKDAGACIEAVVWRKTFAQLRFKPQEGLEVIATGRITTFPGKSKYQIVVDSLAPAGVGALMAMLDERRRKLAAEGLFDAARKRTLPYLPAVIGVVTSPTGSVIRDILHRLEDRFPRRVLVWPARVQGETSAAEVVAGIRGFNALLPGGPIPRPDVIIVARGGGSLEDLWGFNEEAVARAAAESAIPLVSAVGHETDWTLIDHAADMRAPTPTGAAEIVVPVWADLVRGLDELALRHRDCLLRGLQRRRTDLRSAARAMPRPEAFLGLKRQRLDLASAKLKPALARLARIQETRLSDLAQRLARRSPRTGLEVRRTRLESIGDRPRAALERLRARKADVLAATAPRLPEVFLAQLTPRGRRLEALDQLLASLSYRSVLARGFVIVRDEDGVPLHHAAEVGPGQALGLEFGDGIAHATADGQPKARAKTPRRSAVGPTDQRTLFDA